MPEALKTWAACMYGLGLDLAVVDEAGKSYSPLLEPMAPRDVKGLKLSLLNEDIFLGAQITKGEVKTSLSGGREEKKGYRYHSEGLESEQIFGPTKSKQCACGKYHLSPDGESQRRPRQCPDCQVPLIYVRDRRHRMGHIRFERPVPNPYVLLSTMKTWRGMGCRSFLEDQPRFVFERYYDSKDAGETAWREVVEFYSVATSTSERFKKALEEELDAPVTPVVLSTGAAEGDHEEWRTALRNFHAATVREQKGYDPERFVSEAMERFGDKKKGLSGVSIFMNRVFQRSGLCAIDFLAELLQMDPATRGLSLKILPVIPPPLRRRHKIGGRNQPHDLAVLYKEVLKANAELARVVAAATPENVEKSAKYREQRVRLQRAVGHLMCNQMFPPRNRARNCYVPGSPVHQSLSNYMEGKQGLLGGNLLGKRTDYSGRAVIVPDPGLSMDTCRLPLSIAARIYRPQLLAALQCLKNGKPEDQIDQALNAEPEALATVRDTLGPIVAERPVLLCRQPTLHRLSLLAFDAELGYGDVIAIPPLVTKGYNADFDGDQMAVFLPVTTGAIEEAKAMLPSRHLWHPANGSYALSFDQDLALGTYLADKGAKQEVVDTLARRASDPGLVKEIEQLKTDAYEMTTRSGISFSPGELMELATEYENQSRVDADGKGIIEDIVLGKSDTYVFKRIIASGARGDWDTMNYLAGRVNAQRPQSNLAVGLEIGEQLYQAYFGRRNLVDTKLGTAEGGSLTKYLMSRAHGTWITGDDCGTDAGVSVRGQENVWLWLKRVPSSEEVKKLVEKHLGDGEIDALLWDEDGKGRLRWEFATDAKEKARDALDRHPSRRPPSLMALRITRSLGDNEDQRCELIFRCLYGRVLVVQISEAFPKGTCLDNEKAWLIAQQLAKGEINEVRVRSPLTCETKGHDICRSCYGLEWAHGEHMENWGNSDEVKKGTPVGVIAAQAVGEPGTQMALRKKHVAGVTSDSDLSWSGIRTVRELFDVDGMDPIEKRDTLNYIYRANKTHVAPIHFETLIGASPIQGWLAKAADLFTSGDLHKIICSSAIQKREDRLYGAKERVVIGAGLPN